MFSNTTLRDCHPEFGAFTDQDAVITASPEFAFTGKYTVSPFTVEKVPQLRMQLRPAMTQIVKPLELL
jgi:hypothetical protein